MSNTKPDSSQVKFIPAGTGAVVTTVQDKLRESVSVKDFGAVGDGVTDDTAAIQAALDSMTSGGGLILPEGEYAISDMVYIGSNTVFNCYGTLKLISATTSGGMFGTKVNAQNSIVYGLKLDGNNIPGQNGAGVGSNGSGNIQFIGGSMRNFKHDKVIKGGRALSAQVGSLSPSKNIVFTGIHVENCYAAMDYHGLAGLPAYNIVYSNITAENCENLITAFSQAALLPSTGDNASCVVSNVIAVDIGKNVTYDGRSGDTNGVISFDRACNLSLSNIQIYNRPAYGKVGGIFKGKAYKVQTNNITFDGEAVAAVNGDSWRERDVIGNDSYSVTDCNFNFVSYGAVDIIVKPEIGGSGKMVNTLVSGVLSNVTTDTPFHAEMATKTSCILDIRYLATRTMFKSRFDKVWPTTITFTTLTDRLYDLTGIAVINIGGISTLTGTSGGGIGSGTQIGGITAGTGAGGNLFLGAPNGANVAYTTNDGFHINGSAWNGRHFTMGNYHLWIDASARLRISAGAPASDTAGVVVGTQT